MQLSKHFTLSEMTRSMTAQRKGIDNTPGAGEIKRLGDLCYEGLEPYEHILTRLLRLPADTAQRLSVRL